MIYEPYTDLKEAAARRAIDLYTHQKLLGAQDVNEFLKNFSQLETLSVVSADYDGLNYIRGLPNLRKLSLIDCRLVTQGLLEVCKINSLESLAIEYSDYLSHDFFHRLVDLPNLHRFSLNECEFVTDQDLEILSCSARLTSLSFTRTGVTTEGLRYLGSMPQLEELFCHREWVDDSVLEAWTGCQRLRRLSVKCGELTDAGLRCLSKLSSLTHLTFEGDYHWTAEGIESCLSKFENLQELRLNGAGLKDRCLYYFSQLPSLIDLAVEDGRFTWRGVRNLTALKSLQNLHFYLCLEYPTDKSLAFICHLTELRLLSLQICGIKDLGAAHLAALQHLEWLDLSFSRITSKGLQALASLSALQHLDLQKCRLIDDEGLQILGTLKQLTYLDLQECELVTNQGLKELVGLERLEHLNLEGCKNIDDQGVAYLANFRRLKFLNLSGCERITDKGLAYLAGLPEVAYFNIRLCREVTNEGLDYLRGWERLQELRLFGTQVTRAYGQDIRSRYPAIILSPY